LSPELAPAGFGGVGGAGGARVGEVTFEFQPRGSEERERLSGATVVLSTHRVHEVEGLGDTRSGALTETGKGLDMHFACA
jgi:hypothetical protein